MMTDERPANKNRNILVPALIVLIAAAALLLVNFHLLAGQFNAQHQLFTSTFGQEGPQEISQSQSVDLYVLGTNWITRGMVRPLVRVVEENPYIGEVNLREGPPQRADHPVMVVRVDQADLLWLAVYGRGQVKLHVSYSTNGEIDWMDDKVMASMPGPYTKWIGGDFEVTNSAFGLTSLPGYAAYLGEHFGQRISEGLEGALRN